VALAVGAPRGEGTRVIVITSAVGSEGKGSVAAGLAVVLAQEGRRVLLVDADTESPSIGGMVAASNALPDAVGASDTETPLPELAVPICRNVDLLAIGDAQDANSMPKQELASLVARLRSSAYQYAILHVSPLLSSANASWLAASADDVFVVARAIISKERDLIQVRDLLARDRAPFRGIILTDEDERSTRAAKRSAGFALLGTRFKKKSSDAVRVTWNESAGIGPAAK
jgi:Mrp family chromosome partitioning ATPase